ncbi:MAG: class I SAM-dependent methyltransferase [Patescibacteria group bacterium]
MRETSKKTLEHTIESQEIDCPLCESREFEPLYENKFRFWHDNELFLWLARQVICKRCAMVYTNPQPSKESLEWYYETYSRFGEISASPRISQLEFLSSHVSPDCKTLFDVGAFNGDLLLLARDRGYEVSGVEPSLEACQEAAKKYGISISHGFFNEQFVRQLSGSFDIVTIRHVLEHVRDPMEFLELAKRITNPGKYIYVEVPDTERPWAEQLTDFFSFHHLLHFTQSSLRNLAARLGLRIIVMEPVPEISAIRVLLQNEQERQKPLESGVEEMKHVMEEYQKKRTALLEKLRSRLDPQIKRLIIYGAGGHTSQLIQSGILGERAIEAIVDSNPRKWNTFFEGHWVQSPELLRKAKIPVLISSYPFQEEISAYLHHHFPHVQQIPLYERIVSYDTGIIQIHDNFHSPS